MNGSNAVVLCAIAHADIDRTAAADDAHALCRRSIRLARLFGLIRLFRLLARIVIRNDVHHCLMRVAAVDTVLFDTCLRLKLLEGSLCLIAEFPVSTVFGQSIAQLQQEFLHSLHIRALAALFQCARPQRVLAFRGVGLHAVAAGEHCITVIHEGKLIPVRPLPGRNLRFHAAVIEAAFLHGIAVSNVHAHMPVKAQCNAGHIGQRVHSAPRTAPAFRVAEHAVGGFVRAAVAAVLAGKGLVRANGLDHAHAAVRPLVALDQAHAVGADLLLCDVVSVSGGTAGSVVCGILLCFAGAKALRTLVDDRAVPVGLTQHLLTECDEVFISERDIDSLAHCCSLSLSSVSSMRPCSCASTDLSFSGIGSPRCAAFSSMDTDSLER